MPAFAVQQPDLRRVGPVVRMALTIPADMEQRLRERNEPIPQPVELQGMIDTGATGNVIQEGLPAKLGLHPIGVSKIATASSREVECFEYAVRFVFPSGVIVNDTAVEAPLQGQQIEALIGRGVLSLGTFVYLGYAGMFAFSI